MQPQNRRQNRPDAGLNEVLGQVATLRNHAQTPEMDTHTLASFGHFSGKMTMQTENTDFMILSRSHTFLSNEELDRSPQIRPVRAANSTHPILFPEQISTPGRAVLALARFQGHQHGPRAMRTPPRLRSKSASFCAGHAPRHRQGRQGLAVSFEGHINYAELRKSEGYLHTVTRRFSTVLPQNGPKHRKRLNRPFHPAINRSWALTKYA